MELAGDVADLTGARVTVSASVAHDLRDSRGGLVATLEFAADTALGATSITLRLPSDATGLTGQVPKGLELTIAGETSKTVAADALAGNDVIVLRLTAGLAAAHLEGVAVGLATAATFACPDGIEQGVGYASGMVELANGELLIPMAGAPALFRPRLDTILTITNPLDGRARKVRVVSEPQVFAGQAWSLLFSGTS